MIVPANLIDGRAIAAQTQEEVARRIGALKARGVQPGVAFVRVGGRREAGGGPGFRERSAHRGQDHAESRRRGAEDDRHADAEHGAGGRTGRRSGLMRLPRMVIRLSGGQVFK
jgi:hypothetical protein